MRKAKKLIDVTVDDIVDVDTAGNVIEDEGGVEANLYIYTNAGLDAPAESLIRMIYEGALTNTLGIMRALNVHTNETELLIVGVDVTDGGSTVYPIAKVLDHNDVNKYHSPDGKGGWFDPTKAD